MIVITHVQDQGLYQKYFLDSEASRHVSYNLTNVSDVESVEEVVEMDAGTQLAVHKAGPLTNIILVNGIQRAVRIENVAFVLDVKMKLTIGNLDPQERLSDNIGGQSNVS